MCIGRSGEERDMPAIVHVWRSEDTLGSCEGDEPYLGQTVELPH